MRILYLSISYIPSRRASSVQVMKMCAAFAHLGHKVTLVTKSCSARQEPGVGDAYEFYGVKRNFALVGIGRPQWRGGGVLFAHRVWHLLRRSRSNTDLVYSRDLLGTAMSLKLGYRVIFESHGMPPTRSARRLQNWVISHPRFERLVVISEGLRRDLATAELLPHTSKVVVAHDGADRLSHRVLSCENNAHGRLQVGYVGSMARGKGVEMLIELAREAPEFDFHIVGGDAASLRRWRTIEGLSNVTFHGFVAHADLARLYPNFDVVALPAQEQVFGVSGRTDISRWMSPLKLFEYMASGRPIIASDLPVLREVIEHRHNGLLVKPAAVSEWVAALHLLDSNRPLRRALADQARADFESLYTWHARARRVLDGI